MPFAITILDTGPDFLTVAWTDAPALATDIKFESSGFGARTVFNTAGKLRINGLTPGTTYAVSATALTMNGVPLVTAAATGATAAAVARVVPPVTPLAVSISRIRATELEVDWNTPPVGTVTMEVTVAGRPSAVSPGSAPVFWAGLTPDTQYTVTVSARDAAGVEIEADTVIARTLVAPTVGDLHEFSPQTGIPFVGVPGDHFEAPSHGLLEGEPVKGVSTDRLPSVMTPPGMHAGTYWVYHPTADTFQLSPVETGSYPVTIIDNGKGTHTLTRVSPLATITADTQTWLLHAAYETPTSVDFHLNTPPGDLAGLRQVMVFVDLEWVGSFTPAAWPATLRISGLPLNPPTAPNVIAEAVNGLGEVIAHGSYAKNL